MLSRRIAILGLVFATLGCTIIVFLQSRKTARSRRYEAPAPIDMGAHKSEFDRLVKTMSSDPERRFARPPGTAAREPQQDWSQLH